MSSVRIKAASPHRTHKSSSSAQAIPLAASSLLAKIADLEERLRSLEARIPAQNGHANGHSNGHALNGKIINGKTLNGKAKQINGTNGKNLDPQLVVAISSAVAVAIEKPYRIISLAPLEESGGHSACPWALHGRLSLHQTRSNAAWLRR